MTLKARLIALVAGALLISLAAGGFLIMVFASQWVRAEIDTDAQMARQLVEARLAEAAEETESPNRIIELLESLEATHHLHARYLAAGGVHAADDDEVFPGPDAAPPWLGPLLGVRPSVQEIAVTRDGEPAGRIVIRTDPATGVAEVWRLARTGFGLMILFSLSTLALVAFGLAHSLRPLGRLASALSRIGDGDYSARIGGKGPAEVALIGRHFDLMAEQLQEMQARTRALTAQLLAVQERERHDIGRDLHDELGPCLLAASLDVAALKRLNQGGARDAVDECARALGSVLNHMQGLVRQIIGRLHLESAAPFDLGAAAADLAGFWRERSPEITWRVAPWDQWPELPPTRSVALYRIIQEAASNAVRHSGARHVFVDCVCSNDEIVVSVRDDGKGITGATGRGFGLAGMRERIEALGGSLEITTAPGSGTTILARLPRVEPERAETISGDAMMLAQAAA